MVQHKTHKDHTENKFTVICDFIQPTQSEREGERPIKLF